jgi:hypothetical protein
MVWMKHTVALFERKLLIQGDRKDTLELVAALEFMPLAVVQAAVYISQRGLRCLVQQYIEKFLRTDRSKTSLLTHEAGHLRRDRDAKNSIIITWQISFDYIHEERPSAAELLSLMNFFDRQGIPEDLLRSGGETGIIPALEIAHAVFRAIGRAKTAKKGENIVICGADEVIGMCRVWWMNFLS